jgi:phospholipid transport system substrate-binding protein
MTSVRRVVMLGVVAALPLGGGPAWAGAPTEQMQARIERVVRILEDPDMRQDGRLTERRAAIRKVANEIFDFRETSQRSLARHWQGRTASERDEFVTLFADLLERSYIGKIELYTGGDKIHFLGESLDGDQATVRTKIVTKQGTEIPVDYRMIRKGDRWLAYDVAIEGVSLVANYRAQFNKIIQTSSYPGLVQKLRAKREEGLEADAGTVKRASQK